MSESYTSNPHPYSPGVSVDVEVAVTSEVFAPWYVGEGPPPFVLAPRLLRLLEYRLHAHICSRIRWSTAGSSAIG